MQGVVSAACPAHPKYGLPRPLLLAPYSAILYPDSLRATLAQVLTSQLPAQATRSGLLADRTMAILVTTKGLTPNLIYIIRRVR
jgi:hypothetical protein